MRALLAPALALLIAACSTPERTADPGPYKPPADKPPVTVSGGGYYKDDGPGANTPSVEALEKVADAVPKAEPLHRFANNPYEVFGRPYVPMATLAPFKQRGLGSWYGKRYHGARTSSGEVYDMYAMTAAHPTLPIPSYVKVTNLVNGRSVVVRINDRGPFHGARIIDLSYTAAWKLGYIESGSALVEVETIIPGGTVVAAAQQPISTKPPTPPTRPPAAARTDEAQPLLQSTDAKGVYLQLGAFSARDNAENFRARVYRQLAWLNDTIQVAASGNLYKLQLGPYRTNDEARSMAERIQAELDLKPVLLRK